LFVAAVVSALVQDIIQSGRLSLAPENGSSPAASFPLPHNVLFVPEGHEPLQEQSALQQGALPENF